ncbi:MAG: Cof-type HAD-IIB family hydrolase [Clostridia bacterium]|nr:Cof-type HAD-IIB family hydrolase [Clostridia bacterium]
MNSIRLLALDIDDTLIGSDFRLGERTIQAVRAARDRGVKIFLCTGRGYLSSRPIREKLGVSEYSACFGGAIVVRESDGEIVKSEYMRPEDVTFAMKTAFSLGLHAQLYQGDLVILREESKFTEIYTKRLGLEFRVEPELLEKRYEQVPKVLVYSPPAFEEENVARIRELLPAHLHVLTSKPGFIEIGDNRSTKQAALMWMSEQYGIPRENVAAVGDNTLDLDMIEWAGLGCCVENGNPKVKERADMVIPSCREEGVAQFIERFIL